MQITLSNTCVDDMSMHLQISSEPHAIVVAVTGRFSLREAERTFIEILEAVLLHKSTRVLVDGRKLTGTPQTIERFFYGKFAASSVQAFKSRGLSLATTFAYVLEPPILDPQRFGETVARNRGMFVKAFDNIEAACAWLEIAPPHA